MACAPKRACLWCSSSRRCIDSLSSECYHHSLSLLKYFLSWAITFEDQKCACWRTWCSSSPSPPSCWPPVHQFAFSSWEKVSLVFPLLASSLGVFLVRMPHSTSGLSDFLACYENCVRNVRGWVPLYSFWLPMRSLQVSPLMVTVLPASNVQYHLSLMDLCADTWKSCICLIWHVG